MRKVFILSFTLFFFLSSYAKQWILFHAEEGVIGHAFATFMQDDEFGKLKTIGTFGMNGFGIEDIKHDIGYTFYVEVNLNEWERCINTLNEWKKGKTYIPLLQDCVAFMKALVDNLPSISKPGTLFIFPADYIEQLKRLNTQINSNSQISISKSTITTGLLNKTKEEAVEWLAGKIKQHIKKPYLFVSNNQGLLNYSLLTKTKVEGVDKKEESYKINTSLNLNYIKYWDEETKDNPDKLTFGSSDDNFFRQDFVRIRDNKITKTYVSSKESRSLFNFGKGEADCDFSVEPNLIENSKLIIAKIIEFNKTPILFSNSELEQKKIKQAAIDFFKWHENVWESSENMKRLKSFKMILNKFGKPEDDSNSCPCSIDWGELDKFHNWIKSRGQLISDNCFLDSKSSIIAIENKLKRASTTQQNMEAIEEFYLKSMMSFFPGNSGAPKFSQSGIYSNNTIWDISVRSNGTADINVTFQMPKGWGKEIGFYKLKMQNEYGIWKLAAPIEEGKINSSFKVFKNESSLNSKLSRSATLLFDKANCSNYSELTLSDKDKEDIFLKSKLALSKDELQFVNPEMDKKKEYPFDCTVELIDLNGDGKLEAYLHYSNSKFYGSQGNCMLLSKISNNYKIIYAASASISLSNQISKGFPDILGRFGYVDRWNGSEYKFYTEDKKREIKGYTFEEYYNLQKAGKLNKTTENTTISTQNLLGGKTQIELAQILLKALQTNNKETWLKCLHPKAPEDESKGLVERKFKEAREKFLGLGVTNWSLVKFSRAIFTPDQKWTFDDGSNEKFNILKVEFYYNNKEYIGLVGNFSIVTFEGKYFILSAGHTDAELKRNN